MKIKTKLSISYFNIALLFLIALFLILLELENVKSDMKEIIENNLPSTVTISDINTQTSNHMIQLLLHSSTKNDAEMTKIETEVKRIEALIESNRSIYEPLPIVMNKVYTTHLRKTIMNI